MKLKTKNPYQDLCIWLGVILDESPKESVIQWFNDQFDVRITEVEEIQSLYVFGDGSFRNDIIFKIHKDDVSTFAFPRLSTDIKWWGDWVSGLGHREDYSVIQLELYREFEFDN